MEDITLYGAGGHCKVVIDILTATQRKVSRIVDDNPCGESFKGIRLCKPLESYDSAIITIGNCHIRKRIAKSIKVKKYITAIHPLSTVSKNSSIGSGTVISPGAIIQSDAIIGNHCIINTNAIVEHDSKIHDYVHIASGSVICGGCEIGEGTWIGAGSVVIQGVKVGNNTYIGAGSVIVNDIPDDVVAFGNPCRIIKPYNHE